VVSACSAAIFFARVLTARQPIVDLRAFTDRNFAVGSMFSFVLGIGLYGLTYLYPIYLAQIRGFNALMIGQTLFISGATMFLTAPLVGRLMTKVDGRWMLAFGFAVVALSNWQMTYLTRDWEFWQLFLPQVLRGFGMMFAIVPITNISLGTLPPERLKNASGLFPVDQLDGALAVPALVGDRSLQFRARIYQERERGIHAGLRPERIANSQARNDQNPDQQFLLRHKARHCFLLQRDMRIRTCRPAICTPHDDRRITRNHQILKTNS
jgi:hypothetical protein